MNKILSLGELTCHSVRYLSVKWRQNVNILETLCSYALNSTLEIKLENCFLEHTPPFVWLKQLLGLGFLAKRTTKLKPQGIGLPLMKLTLHKNIDNPAIRASNITTGSALVASFILFTTDIEREGHSFAVRNSCPVDIWSWITISHTCWI